jgi:hypothetical protein
MKDAVFICFGTEETDLQSEETTPSRVVLEYNPLKSKMLLLQTLIHTNADNLLNNTMTLQLYHIYFLPVHDQVKCVYLGYFTLTFYYTASNLILSNSLVMF